jgi:E3 ubiquitin-protein ligase BOI-like protein
VFGDIDLAWNDNHGFVQRKRARVVSAAPSFLENQRAQGLLPVGDVLTRAAGSGAASTSGRITNAAGLQQDLLSTLSHQGTEIDALVRIEVRRIRSCKCTILFSRRLETWNRVLGLLDRCSDSRWF